MIWLILGVALWTAAHFFKRLAPKARATMGDTGKLVVAVLIVVSVVLMVLGYRAAEGQVFWTRHPALVGINNLIMIFALYFTSPGPKKGALFHKMRHPMLFGFLLWCFAHLLVNGDVPSFVLFGGLAQWAVVSMLLINRAQPEWTPPAKGSLGKDGMFLAISVLLVGVIGYVHTWLGAAAFG